MTPGLQGSDINTAQRRLLYIRLKCDMHTRTYTGTGMLITEVTTIALYTLSNGIKKDIHV